MDLGESPRKKMDDWITEKIVNDKKFSKRNNAV
jgi:hypothetical protein